MARRKVIEILASWSSWLVPCGIELIEELQRLYNSVPEKYRGSFTTELEVGIDSFDGIADAEFIVYYWRHETDEEYQSRRIEDEINMHKKLGLYYDKVLG